MAKSVVWSEVAKNDLISIKTFFDKRNKSSNYSTKLLKTFRSSARLIEKYLNAGIHTSIVGVQGLITSHYILFFKHQKQPHFDFNRLGFSQISETIRKLDKTKMLLLSHKIRYDKRSITLMC